jgi:hypothetical protein
MYKKGIKERGSKGMGKRRLCFHVFDRTVYRIFCKVTPIFSDDKESINNYVSDFLKGQRVGKKRGRRKYTPCGDDERSMYDILFAICHTLIFHRQTSIFHRQIEQS